MLIAAVLLTLALQAPALDDLIVTGTVDEVRAAISAGANVNAADTDGVTPLMRAASAGRADVVRVLIASGAQANTATKTGETSLMMASLGGYADVVDQLLAAKADAKGKDSQGRTALMAAAFSGDASLIATLLKAGASVGAEDSTGSSALTYAAAEGHTSVVSALLRAGARAGDSELILAAGRCNAPVVRLLLDRGMPVDAANANSTPLIAAAARNCAGTVDLLLARGANVNAQNNEGATALIRAASDGHAEMVEMLLAAGAEMDIADRLGRTAWTYAAAGGHDEVAAIFRRERPAKSPSGQRAVPLEIASPMLKPDAPMPRDFTADGRDVSPPITWTEAPDGTKSFAVVCVDTDAGHPPPFVHWILYNIPSTAGGVPEHLPAESSAMPKALAGAIQGPNNFGRPGYRGPAPPRGNAHHYRVSVYALDLSALPPGLSRSALLERIDGHVLAEGVIVVTYQRQP